MANAKEYGYFLKGNKVAIVEKETTFDNDANSRDYGPGSDRAQWKSPLTAVTDGLEIEYTYAPEYRINDIEDKSTSITGYDEDSGLLKFTGSGLSTDAAITYIVIDGSERWRGLHKIKTLNVNYWIVETKYNGAAVTENPTAYTDISVMNSATGEDFELPVTAYQADAMVYYIKAKIAEDRQEYDKYEYLISKFKKMLEQNESAKVWGARMLASGPNAVR